MDGATDDGVVAQEAFTPPACGLTIDVSTLYDDKYEIEGLNVFITQTAPDQIRVNAQTVAGNPLTFTLGSNKVVCVFADERREQVEVQAPASNSWATADRARYVIDIGGGAGTVDCERASYDGDEFACMMYGSPDAGEALGADATSFRGSAYRDYISGIGRDGVDDCDADGLMKILGDQVLYLSGDIGGNDTIIGCRARAIIHAGAGNDYVQAGANHDEIYGQRGNDTIRGGRGADYIEGNLGNDDLNGQNGADEIWGGSGSDLIAGGGGNDVLYGNDQDDTIAGGAGADVIQGNAGNDTIRGDNGADEIKGGNGNDTIYGGGGSDILNGNGQNDHIVSNDDTVADQVNGGPGTDLASAGANDTVTSVP